MTDQNDLDYEITDLHESARPRPCSHGTEWIGLILFFILKIKAF